MTKKEKKIADGVCDRSKENTRAHARLYGWCRACECITLCPYKRKIDDDKKKVRENQ